MQDFEQLASFYLGRVRDVDEGVTTDAPLLYDAKDLTTHAVCVGMTGSGKTGLCIGLLEEAALDGVPALVIDPKGDMGNLMLTFPELRAADFEPWVDPGEAARKEQDVASFASDAAESWKQGLAEWGQAPERIQRLKDAADVAIYTPGSRVGLPLTVLKSFDAPPAELREDAELFGDRVEAAVSGLLALVGVDADPLQSRESILLSNILQQAWHAGQNVTLADLIRSIQDPPFERLGVLELESFFPKKERFGLAMQLNNLLASPGFQSWLEGQSLNVQELLWTADGKPRIAILSIAHLSDAERMFFVTILLNEVVAWMRTQPGTSSLRALLYMDEIFGYFPPSKEPPSKKPMLTLLKQARAFGLGVVLATQNPVDLDYKGLSNTGTWFIGRLQTERDKLRVLDGLEGAMATSGKTFDRATIDRILSGLGKRVFLLNNVHEDGPVLFQTRWAMSYLRGPLTRDQIKQLMAARQAAAEERAPEDGAAASPGAASALSGGVAPATLAQAKAPAKDDPELERPVLPDGIQERFLRANRELAEGQHWLFKPALRLESKLHHVKSTVNLDRWTTLATWAVLEAHDGALDWDECAHLTIGDGEQLELDKDGPPGARFGTAPPEACRKQTYISWKADLKRWLYEKRALEFWVCKDLELASRPEESERDFRSRLAQAARERRDEDLEQLRDSFGAKRHTQQERIRKAQQKVGQEQEQVSAKQKDSLISAGASLLGALFGRKLGSHENVNKVGSTARSLSRIQKEKADVERAQRDLEAARQKLELLEGELAERLRERDERWSPSQLEVTRVIVRARKSDLAVTQPVLVWLPYLVDAEGLAEPAFELEA